MNWGYTLATLNASLNGTAACLLFAGWVAIRSGKQQIHKRFMISAFVISCLFLISYITRVIMEGTHRYPGEGFWRIFYLTMLATHVVLAATIPFLAIRTIYLALKGRFKSHRKIAVITWPIWMYVSITGVLIYFMLYHWA